MKNWVTFAFFLEKDNKIMTLLKSKAVEGKE